MKLLYDLFGQLYKAQKFSELINDRVIFQKLVFGFFYCYSLFLAISFRVIDTWYLEFLIIGLLYYAQYYQGSSSSSVFWLILEVILSMQYSGNFITKQCYQVSIIRYRSKIYTTGSAEDVYILIIVQLT